MIASVGIVLSLVIVGTVAIDPSVTPTVARTVKLLAPATRGVGILKVVDAAPSVELATTVRLAS